MRGGTGLLVVLLAVLAGGLLLLLGADGTVFGMADDQFAGLLRLSVIGIFLASGMLLARRMRLGPAVRDAAIWGAILVALLAAYAYADEFRGVAGRIQAALLPGSVVALDSAGAQVMATRGAGRHFQIDAEINGVRTPMLVDTGASIVAIDRSTAEAIGIDVGALRYTARVTTANGIANAAPIRIDEIRVGGIARRNVPAVVTEGDGIGIDLLGMSFLGTLSSVDFRGDRLVLSD